MVRAVFQIDAGRDLARAADDTADHAAAVNIAADGEIAHGRGGLWRSLVLIKLAEVADESDRLRIGIALRRVAVAVQIRDAMSLPVKRAVEEGLDHIVAVGCVHGIFAADRRPVAFAAHIEIGRQIDRFVRKIMILIADIDRAV